MEKLLRDYFQGSGRSLQEYFKFPEMRSIKNPVHEYFRLGSSPGSTAPSCWIQEGNLPIETGEDGWIYLGAEHQELAKIAVSRSGSRHYRALPWGDLYLGPVLRTTAAAVGVGAFVVRGSLTVTATVVSGAASLVYQPGPTIPGPDVQISERFVEESVEVNGNTWWFRVFLPEHFHDMKAGEGGLAAFLLLHGFKECGWDNWWQTQSGLATHLLTSRSWARWFPGILVLPQLPRRPCDEDYWEHWRDPLMQRMALACLEKAVAKYGANRKRLYLLGESLGAEGAWYLAASQPGHFAAVGGSCGSIEPYNWSTWEWAKEPERYRKLAEGIGRHTPMWICHGIQDDFVPIEQARRFVNALKEARSASKLGSLMGQSESAEVVFSEYDSDHHVWDRAYEEGGLIQWLVQQSK